MSAIPRATYRLQFSAAFTLDDAVRLAYWRVAADEINYRRFFDVNDLAALRQEDEEVFETTHDTVLRLAAGGKVDGLLPLARACARFAVAAWYAAPPPARTASAPIR